MPSLMQELLANHTQTNQPSTYLWFLRMLLSVEVFLQLASVYLVEVVCDWLPSPGHLALQRRQLLNTKYGANVCHNIVVEKTWKMNKDFKKVDSDNTKIKHKESEGMAKTEPQSVMYCEVLLNFVAQNLSKLKLSY